MHRPFTVQQFLDFYAIFFPQIAPHFFCLHDSPSDLAESRYPLMSRDINRFFPRFFSLDLGSVLAEIVFPLHASKISEKSETGREKYVSVPTESSHFFPFKFFLYRRGPKVTFIGKGVTKNITS